MARRWQIMKKTDQGIFRATTDRTDCMEEIVKIAQADPECRWIVVKDRVENRRHQIWRRSTGVVIEPWWREDSPEPRIAYGKKIGKTGD